MAQSDLSFNENQGKHICGMFRGTSRQTELAADFLGAGLQKSEKCLLIASPGLTTHVSGLLEQRLDDFRTRLDRKEIEFIDPHNFFLNGGFFSLERVFSTISGVYQEAISSGFQGMRGIGDMNWALKSWNMWDNLFGYEAKINEFIKERYLNVICLYDPAVFPAKHLYRAMLTHPHLATDNYSGSSPTFVPAAEFMQEEWKSKFDSAALNQTGKQFIVVEQKASPMQAEEKPLTDKMLDHIKDCILLVDSEGVIRYMNQAAQNRYGNQVNRVCHQSVFKDAQPCPVCQLLKLSGQGKEKF